jgi:hypothetical protein
MLFGFVAGAARASELGRTPAAIIISAKRISRAIALPAPMPLAVISHRDGKG